MRRDTKPNRGAAAEFNHGSNSRTLVELTDHPGMEACFRMERASGMLNASPRLMHPRPPARTGHPYRHPVQMPDRERLASRSRAAMRSFISRMTSARF